MGQHSHISKDHFYIFSTAVQSFKHEDLAFEVGYKTNVSLESHFYLIFIVSLLPTASSWRYQIDHQRNHLPSFGHWNLNRLPAHNVARMLLLKTYNAIYKYDFTYFYETYLDSSILSEHVSLDLESYKLVQADHPNNVKRGGVCI